MNTRRRFLHLATSVSTCLWLAIANIAVAQSLDGPVLLVASPDVQGLYSQAVVIALPVGGKQHVGFIVNRPSKHKLASVFPSHAPSRKVLDPIYIGGPDSLGTIFAFVRTKSHPPANSVRLFEDLFVTSTPKSIKGLIERTPNKARYVTGYISWFEDELEGEVESGFWSVSEPQAELLFRKDVSVLWAELIARMPRKESVSLPSDRRLLYENTGGGERVDFCH
jgi:putative AlgH/UPF0301 family transcriptional regulator